LLDAPASAAGQQLSPALGACSSLAARAAAAQLQRSCSAAALQPPPSRAG
jgi:hypothetical protein